MKVIFTLLAGLLLLASCTAGDHSDRFTEVEDVIEAATAVEENDSSAEVKEEVVEFIEFDVDGNDVVLDVHKIPILYEFLNGQKDQQLDVSDMELERIPLEHENIYTLSFSCVNERCSHLLLHQDQNKQTFLVADMAQYVNSHISPDETKIALHFNRSLGADTVTLSNLIIMDVKNWEVQPITNEETEISLLNYRWPFVAIEWLDNESIAISIPDLIEPNKDSFEEWSSSETNSVSTIIYYTKEE